MADGCSTLMVLVSTAVLGLMMAGAAGAQTMSVSPSPAPSSGVDCSAALARAVNCLGYVSEGSNMTSPGSACCSSIEDIITNSPVCLCQLIGRSGSLGIPVDRKRALGIPNACKLSAPPLGACSLHGVPIPGPSQAPPPAVSVGKAPMIWETPAGSPSPSPAAGGGGSPDCNAAYMSAFSCLDYITTGSNQTSPTSDCCSGISNLITGEPVCLCQLLGASTPPGISIDRKRALGLPGACKVKSLPLSYCSKMGYSVSVPGGAPSPSPAAGGGLPVSPSPAPGEGSPDCNAAYMSAFSCLDYITTGSNQTSPASDCCSGIGHLITDEPTCLCQLQSASTPPGISIDRKRALGLPGACKLKSLPLGYCSKMGYSVSVPGGAPSPSPAAGGGLPVSPSPAPGEGSPDCNAAYMSAFSCLDYITTGSNQTSPASDCCSGIGHLITDEPTCLCQLQSASTPPGISVDRKRALGLPGACKLKSLPLGYCSTPGESDAAGDSSGKGDGMGRFGFRPSVLLSTAIATIATGATIAIF
ncbi:unnamed protein product [Victoria cruziana]